MAVNTNYNAVPWLREPTANSVEYKDKSILDKDDFLKLFLAQLQHQDPLEPMDNDKMMSQMASFTTVEQMTNLNKSFGNMSALLTDQFAPMVAMQQSASMIGRQVAYIDPTTEDGQDILTGVINSVMFDNGVPVYVVGDQKQLLYADEIIEWGALQTNEELALALVLQELADLRAELAAQKQSNEEVPVTEDNNGAEV